MAVKGLAELRAKLKALPDAMRAEIRVAMETGAREMVEMARRLVPVDDGTLRDSIGWTWGDAPDGAKIIARAGSGAERITIYAGSNEAFYMRWVEFGTVNQPAQAFFFPSWRAIRKRVKSRTTKAVKKAVEKVANGGG